MHSDPQLEYYVSSYIFHIVHTWNRDFTVEPQYGRCRRYYFSFGKYIHSCYERRTVNRNPAESTVK